MEILVSPAVFLVLNLALAFYNVGTIWAHEVDIFRAWRLVEPSEFHRIQGAHWRKLPYWVLVPFGVALLGSIALVWYQPIETPPWAVWGALSTQLAAHVGTLAVWAPWQAKLSKDPLGSRSPYLTKILSTHWIRTLLVNAYALILLLWLLQLPVLR
jgi:hypothetical protein